MKTKHNIYKSLISAFSTAAVLSISPAGATSPDLPCYGATALSTESAYKSEYSTDDAFYSFEARSAGILSFEVRTSLEAAASPEIQLFDAACQPTDVSLDFVTLDRSASHRTIALRTPTELYIRVAAADPSQALGAHAVRARLAAAASREDFFEVELGGRWGTAVRTDLTLPRLPVISNEDDDEVDPDPELPSVTVITLHDPLTANRREDNEVDPDPRRWQAGTTDSNEDDDEVDPDPLKGQPGATDSNEDDDEVDPDPERWEPGPWKRDPLRFWGRTVHASWILTGPRSLGESHGEDDVTERIFAEVFGRGSSPERRHR